MIRLVLLHYNTNKFCL